MPGRRRAHSIALVGSALVSLLGGLGYVDTARADERPLPRGLAQDGSDGSGPLLRVAPRADAPPTTAYELPFPCGQSWTGTTRSSHSPSVKSIDWNRPDDVDDTVVASAAGTVTWAARATSSGYGNYVVIDHGHDESTLYAHLNSIAVSKGQRVEQGAVIGTLGSTGNSTGPHLHYEQRLRGSDRTVYLHGSVFAINTTVTSYNCPVVPLAGNLLGGRVDANVVFRRTAAATFRVQRPGRSERVFTFGTAADQPVLGDWDGNGAANPGVWDPRSRRFELRVAGKVQTIDFGTPGSIPVAGDWDGDGRDDVGTWRTDKGLFRVRFAADHVVSLPMGDGSDLPVTGDWDHNGRTDLGVYDQATSTFLLRRVDDEGLVWLAQVQYGDPGDLPVAGDWDGDGRTDLGVYDPRTGRFAQRLPTTALALRWR